MFPAEQIVLVVLDLEARDVAQGAARAVVLALHLEDLEDLPAEGVKVGDTRGHILFEIVPAHDRIEFLWPQMSVLPPSR